MGFVGALLTVVDEQEVTELVRMSVSSTVQSKGIGSMLCQGKDLLQSV